MTTLAPLETLYDTDHGSALPMPPELAMIYGKLQFPSPQGRPLILGNFVETLDGVVSLNIPGHSGGAEVSGNNQQDRILMGLLRAACDAVVVGAGTLRAVPNHLWTAGYIFPELADEYTAFRRMIGKAGQPLNVIVSASGNLDPQLPVFASGEVPVLIVTNPQGLEEVRKREMPSSVHVEAVAKSGPLTAQAVIDAIQKTHRSDRILVEGGPHLIGEFYAEDKLDELFLTLSPQVAGREDAHPRPGLVEGKQLAPNQPVWGDLISVHRGDSHLFLRYSFT